MTTAEPAPVRAWETTVGRLFAAIDGGDVDGLVALFAPDARQRLGNGPWTSGRDAIRAGNVAFLSHIAGLAHEVTGAWESGGTVLIRSDVRYDLLDGRSVVVPAMAAFTRDAAGLISTYQVWSDTSALSAG